MSDREFRICYQDDGRTDFTRWIRMASMKGILSTPLDGVKATRLNFVEFRTVPTCAYGHPIEGDEPDDW